MHNYVHKISMCVPCVWLHVLAHVEWACSCAMQNPLCTQLFLMHVMRLDISGCLDCLLQPDMDRTQGFQKETYPCSQCGSKCHS
ncbi:hypothetical protein DUNSADRAFT_2226 [Dunaliella salina]|uniref:Secreted protein n=1 Tax=Dunaliella salina TaxID=3046 RepID=A0ABQ7GVW7_DUNSA|nr:hypothetical protein DUNSADRAFT_2226 [Dunaliella salina]|eukprot:KAF5838763.1 hypothetical protein DUNSADRAFT_2226 [Dunaliella salina]